MPLSGVTRATRDEVSSSAILALKRQDAASTLF
jgi:hypothetical protein